MLHELCHIEHGPHNADFYKLWDEIRKECEELITKGITGTGQGFDVPGRRLGGFSRQPPLSSLRQTALAAAEKRARIGAILPSGPKRLGGDSDIMVALSPIQAAAMAAERRLQDDLWCGSKSYAGSSEVESNTVMLEQFPPKESAESSKDSIAVKTDSSNVIPQNKGSTSTSTSGSTVNHCTTDNSEDQAIWACKMCTLLNPLLAPVCEACGTQKPKDVGTKFKVRSCRFCTLENSVKLEKCSACGQWRYSYGPPMSTRGPNLGT